MNAPLPSPFAAIDPASRSTTVTSFLSSLAIRAGISFRWICTIGAVVGVIATVWRGLDLYELSVKTQTVEARINLERHRLMIESLRVGGAALTANQIQAALVDGMNSTPLPAPPVVPSIPAAKVP